MLWYCTNVCTGLTPCKVVGAVNGTDVSVIPEHGMSISRAGQAEIVGFVPFELIRPKTKGCQAADKSSLEKSHFLFHSFAKNRTIWKMQTYWNFAPSKCFDTLSWNQSRQNHIFKSNFCTWWIQMDSMPSFPPCPQGECKSACAANLNKKSGMGTSLN